MADCACWLRDVRSAAFRAASTTGYGIRVLSRLDITEYINMYITTVYIGWRVQIPTAMSKRPSVGMGMGMGRLRGSSMAPISNTKERVQ
jgi:hypothetical protein